MNDGDEGEVAANVTLLLETPPLSGSEAVCYHCIIAAAYHRNGDSMDMDGGVDSCKTECIQPLVPNLPRRSANNCTRKVCKNDIREELSSEEAKQQYSIQNDFAKFIRSFIEKK